MINNNIALISTFYNGFVESMHPPLGLITLRSFLLEKFNEVSILDGFNPTKENINKLINSYDIFGIQIHALNIDESITLARILKSYGKKVIIGGPEITISKELSWAKDSYDIAVRSHINEQIISSIEKLSRNEISFPIVIEGSNNIENRINYSGIDFSEYWNRGKMAEQILRHAPVITHLGCSFRDKTNGGCSFCSDIGQKTKVRNIEILTQELWQLYNDYQVNLFYCVGENLAKGISNKLINYLDFPPNTKWSFFARASEINDKTIENLLKLKVQEIRLGAESGSSEILAKTSKGETLNSIENAIRILDYNNITITISFILGLPGETIQSLNETYKVAEEWSKKYKNLRISTSIIQPISGSYLGSIHGVKAGIGISKINQLEFIKKYTSVSFEQIQEIASNIFNNLKFVNSALTTTLAPWKEENNIYLPKTIKVS